MCRKNIGVVTRGGHVAVTYAKYPGNRGEYQLVFCASQSAKAQTKNTGKLSTQLYFTVRDMRDMGTLAVVD